MCGIYKITNMKNNKMYIGQSVNIESRWKKHRTGPFSENNNQYNSSLYRAIRKYGIQNFRFEVIEECSKENLNDREIFWIGYYYSNNPDIGYNLTSGGNTATATTLTLQQVEEIQNLLLNTRLSQEKIGEQFGVDQRSISYINTGVTWLNSNLSYPLRTTSILKKDSPICSLCGTPVTRAGNLCIKCAHKKQQVSERPSREQLKLDIRTMSFTSIGRKYKVSDNAIRKWCNSMNLPSKVKEIKQISDKDWEKI